MNHVPVLNRVRMILIGGGIGGLIAVVVGAMVGLLLALSEQTSVSSAVTLGALVGLESGVYVGGLAGLVSARGRVGRELMIALRVVGIGAVLGAIAATMWFSVPSIPGAILGAPLAALCVILFRERDLSDARHSESNRQIPVNGPPPL